MKTAEDLRLEACNAGQEDWRRWGPYLSERQWGTVREDYSADGSAWTYLPHDHARSRAYRWGEDGIGGISDDEQRLCFAVALWNGKDPILKERLFGLTGTEGNHGEDVKELYYYLDATPTHSYLKMLYKYPQAEFPYTQLVEENRRRSKREREFELLDTGIFDDDRYFDVFIEYAKAGPDDVLIRITAHNRGPQTARLHLLPHLWFRNTWSWHPAARKPLIEDLSGNEISAQHSQLGEYVLSVEGSPEFLFCENETNVHRVFGVPASQGCFKDGINDLIVNGQAGAAHRESGTKAAAHYDLAIEPGQSHTTRLRLTKDKAASPFADFDRIFDQRIQEADEFYARVQHDILDHDARMVQRQALAGMIWSKQSYRFDIPQWLNGDPTQPPPPAERLQGRDHNWQHLNTGDILSMPDKWEYPWFAAWDLAFHCLPLALVDAEFAKNQLLLLTREWYMHPNGQLPAYEWAFGDVNPPVHAWAAWRVFEIDREQRGGAGDLPFLERVFHKLLLNFTWWVNRKDVQGHNIFQGGFLGLDNIGVFDRSAELPTGGFINQADGTSWMAMYCLNLMRIAIELAQHNPVYEDVATKFFEHFLYIAGALTNLGGKGISLWNEEDQFFYDALNLPNGVSCPLKLRSLVGLMPLFAVETLEPEMLERVPEFTRRLEWFLSYRPDLANLVSRWAVPGSGDRRLLSLLRGHRMKQLLKRMLDETEFLSAYGVRSLSRYHLEHPYVLDFNGQEFTVRYTPAESDCGLFGGNSNWRGPIWMPMNFLIIESLHKFHRYYGDDFKIECPTGSGQFITIAQAADELACRLTRLFLRNAQGKRPVLGYHDKLESDPQFRDYVLFHEAFDGDSGRGVGASHQTGWTGLIALLLSKKASQTFDDSRPADRKTSLKQTALA